MRFALQVLLVPLAAVLLVSCASRRVPAPELSALADAHRQVRDGCFACLEEALGAFERLAAAPTPVPAAIRGAFTTSVLLAVRAKELGLPEAARLDRVRHWAAQLPASPTELPPAAYIDALDLVVGETSGFPPETREERATRRRALWTDDGSIPPARARLSTAPPTDIVAQYLALTLDCEDGQARQTLHTAAVVARNPVPLIRFRAAMCQREASELQRLRDEDLRWTDAFFVEGQIDVTRQPVPDIARAADSFERAYKHFPASSAITLALANARNALGDYEPALALFDAILANEPDHADALHGRLLSLTYLNRQVTAIRTATRLIDMGRFHLEDALYWRAWNRYRNHELPAAWQDVVTATPLLENTSIYTLAGTIAFARQWPETAIARLDHAYQLDATNCEAVWMVALVHVAKEDWTPASQRFATSAECFEKAADDVRRERSRVEASDTAEAHRARRAAALTKQIDTAEHRRAQSAFNAAGAYARLGQKSEAAAFVEMAARHPLLKEKAEALRISISKLR